jgi:hypothetical protein
VRAPRLVDASEVELDVPHDLGPEGRAAYREVLGIVEAAGATDPLTLARVADLAHATDTAAKARRQVRRFGLTILGSKGTRVANPAVGIARDAMRTAEVLRRSIRDEVVAARAPDDDAVDHWLAVVDAAYAAEGER